MPGILITGCEGQLGRAVNQMAGSEYRIINTDVHNLDITSVEDVMKIVSDTKPDAIINCAAHTGVDACEDEEERAYAINAIGPRNLSIAAKSVGAKLVHISTDYVFDGETDRPYTETDIPNPKGAYGRTKLAGEEFVKMFADRYFIIRTAWLYGDGKNFVKTMLKLSETNDTVRVVGDQTGSPTSASELARLIFYLLPTDNYGIFHGTCGGYCSWADFAKEIFRLAGRDTKVEYITSDEFKTKAVRPKYSVLDKYMLRVTSDFVFKDWKEAIAEYMSEL